MLRRDVRPDILRNIPPSSERLASLDEKLFRQQQHRQILDDYKNKEQKHFLTFSKASEDLENKEAHIQRYIKNIGDALFNLNIEGSLKVLDYLNIRPEYIYGLGDYFEKARGKIAKNRENIKRDLGKPEYSIEDAKRAHNRIKELSQDPVPTSLGGLEHFRASLEQQTNIKILHFDTRKNLYESYSITQDQYIDYLKEMQGNLYSYIASQIHPIQAYSPGFAQRWQNSLELLTRGI